MYIESRRYRHEGCIWEDHRKSYWACRANKNTIIDGADREQVLQAVHDPKCKAWKLKLNGRKTVDPTSLVDDPHIAPQMASQMISIKLEEVWELVEGEISGKTPQQLKMIKDTIKNICKSKALTHRHTVDSADHLATLTNMVSLPISLKVMNSTM